jgi:hypothetical protein
VDVRVDIPIGGGFSAVGRIETGFNPLSGQLTDACASIADNSGVKQGSKPQTPTAAAAVNLSMARRSLA